MNTRLVLVFVDSLLLDLYSEGTSVQSFIGFRTHYLLIFAIFLGLLNLVLSNILHDCLHLILRWLPFGFLRRVVCSSLSTFQMYFFFFVRFLPPLFHFLFYLFPTALSFILSFFPSIYLNHKR